MVLNPPDWNHILDNDQHSPAAPHQSWFICSVIDRTLFFAQIEEMSVFQGISLKPEVTDFLKSVFLNKEVGIYLHKFLGSSFSPLENHKYTKINTQYFSEDNTRECGNLQGLAEIFFRLFPFTFLDVFGGIC